MELYISAYLIGVVGDRAKGFKTGVYRARGFAGNRNLPLRGGSWAVTGNSESTGFSWSMETETVLEPIWREKHEKPLSKELCRAKKVEAWMNLLSQTHGMNRENLVETWSKLGLLEWNCDVVEKLDYLLDLEKILQRREIRTVSRNSPGRTNGEPKTASEEEIWWIFSGNSPESE